MLMKKNDLSVKWIIFGEISLPDTFINPLATSSKEVGPSYTLSGESDQSRRSKR